MCCLQFVNCSVSMWLVTVGTSFIHVMAPNGPAFSCRPAGTSKMGNQESMPEEKSDTSVFSTLITKFVDPETLPPPYGKQNCSTPQDICTTALGFLKVHTLTGKKWGLSYRFCRPSLQKYAPHQWLWDDCAHMVTWSHFDVSVSIAHFRTMLQMQQTDGRIPQIIYWGDLPVVEQMALQAVNSSNQFPDITQMPLPPYALKAIYSKTKDVAHLKEFLPAAVSYHKWWLNTRCPDSDDLVVIIHPWESGLDASPAYDPAWGITDPKPSFVGLYSNFWKVNLEYKVKHGWNLKQIVNEKKNCGFIFKDVGVNSVYASGWGILANLASEMKDETLAAECRNYQSRVEKAILRKMWSEKHGRFVCLYRDQEGNEKISSTETVQSLFPLLLDSLPADKLDSIIKTQLTNPNKFWTNYPVPSVPADSPSFEPQFSSDRNLMWRGPTWGMLNWLIINGLVKHNKKQIANDLLDRWIAAYQKSGIFEMWDPVNGVGYGVEGLGMSTLIVDALVNLERTKILIKKE